MSYANRGMSFELIIDRTNQMYERKGIAVINKRPTPVKILGRNQKGMIHGYLEKPSTVDYDGTFQGKSVVFEAKSVRDLARFDLKNLHAHQVEYLLKCDAAGAISFLLVEFTKHRLTYLMPTQTLNHYWMRGKKGGRGIKSISIEDFEIQAYQVFPGQVPVDYLKVVSKLWKEEVQDVT